jgi:serine/threonine protein kinase
MSEQTGKCDDLYGIEIDGFAVVPPDTSAPPTLEALVSRYADEVRAGARPSIDSYVDRYPALAEGIRELFPLIATLEGWKNDTEMECVRRNLPRQFPSRMGGYCLVRELGRGGMGVVFEAVHQKSQARVAIKLLPWRFAASRPAWKERFHREAATIARLRNRNIVQVSAFGTHDGYCYYVMELVEGVGLDQILQWLRDTDASISIDKLRREGGASFPPVTTESPLCVARDSWSLFAKIGMQVALALAHAHQRGVLHNDIKPANLLLKPDGQVVVTDFGVAAPADDPGGGLTPTAMGTWRYMAPERFTGPATPQSDIYSLGATLYELVTRQPAFDAVERRELIERILRGRPVAPRQIISAIPRPLETIILTAAARRPEDRYSSARALAGDLLRFSNGEPILARRPSIFRRIVSSFRRST